MQDELAGRAHAARARQHHLGGRRRRRRCGQAHVRPATVRRGAGEAAATGAEGLQLRLDRNFETENLPARTTPYGSFDESKTKTALLLVHARCA